MSIACVGKFARFGLLSRKRERGAVERIMRSLEIKAELDSDVSSLSGGNQQKVILGKWLLADTKVMLFYDPTRGVDVGVKADIFEWMRQFASSGGAILFYSSDIDELVHLCDRVLVFYEGAIHAELAHERLSHETVLGAILGQANGS